MSATRDSSQPVTFVFTSLHEVYRKGLDAARKADGATEPLPDPARVDLVHPRFGASAPAGQENLFALRSETYRVIKPGKTGETPARKASLRSSGRVLKAGQIHPGVRTHQPASFLRNRFRRPESAELRIAPVAATIRRIEQSEGSSPAVRSGAGRLRETLARLDRLQSRLHFLLREIKDYSGEGDRD